MIALLVVPVVGAVTSSYARPRPSRELQEGCNFTFTTLRDPKDDYFRGSACDTQVHVTLGSATSVVVSFVSADLTTRPEVRIEGDVVLGEVPFSYTSLISIDPMLAAPAMGDPTASTEELKNLRGKKGLLSYKYPGSIYSSPLVHTIHFDHLDPGVTYSYTLPGDDDERKFRFPRSSYPLKFGLAADVGQTAVSNKSLTELQSMDPDLILIAGDLAYADGWPFRWDTFGALLETTLAEIPILTTGGNHEIGSSENWLHYMSRYPTPYTSSQSTSPLYYSVDVGPIHVVSLNAYDNFVQGGDRLQRQWLLNDLKAVDRSRTPWIVVQSHVPFYTSNLAHPGEGDFMRQAYEPILFGHGVDLIIAGHVHAYERIGPIYNYTLTSCGPTFIDLGDGGNRENTNVDWIDPQPGFSAFRESSFGVGSVTFESETSATYTWHRDACGDPEHTPPGYDLDAAHCHTPEDHSGFPYTQVDTVTIEKTSHCVQHRRDAVLNAGLSLDDFPNLIHHRKKRKHHEAASSSSSSSSPTKNDHRRHHLLGLTLVAIAGLGLVALIARPRRPRRDFLPIPEYKVIQVSIDDSDPLNGGGTIYGLEKTSASAIV